MQFIAICKFLKNQTLYSFDKTSSLCKIGQITKFYPPRQLHNMTKPIISTWTDHSTINYIKSE